MKARIALVVLAILVLTSLTMAGDKDGSKTQKATGDKSACCTKATKASLMSGDEQSSKAEATNLPPGHPKVDGKSCCTESATKASMKSCPEGECTHGAKASNTTGKASKVVMKSNVKSKGARAEKQSSGNGEGKGTN